MLIDNNYAEQRIVNGVSYSYDAVRKKWLSVDKYDIFYSINHKNISASRWLVTGNGIYSNNIGLKIFNKGTIIMATLQLRNPSSCKFVVKDGYSSTILSLELNNECDKMIETNIDFEESVSLGCFLVIENNKVDFPFIALRYAFNL